MDFNNLAMMNEATLKVINPKSGKESDAEIVLFSRYSQEFIEAKKEVLKIKSLDETFFQIELLTRITKEIKGFTDGKKVVESNQENIRKLYEMSPYIREEADIFLTNIDNFFLNK